MHPLYRPAISPSYTDLPHSHDHHLPVRRISSWQPRSLKKASFDCVIGNTHLPSRSVDKISLANNVDLEAATPSILQDGSTSQLVASAAVPPNHVPPFTQSGLVLLLNFLLNITFFIIVPTSASYANELGASTWFSGLTIGISTLVAGSFLVPFSRRYSRVYKFPFLFASVCIMVGEVIYALAGVANTAWLMFLGRIVLGAGFVSWMYVKKYMTDSIVVGTSKRTMMSACLVTTQVGGMAVGPFIGGLLSKRVRPMTDSHRLWNGFTASGWIMAGVWLLFFALTWFVFREPAPPIASSGNSQIELGLLRDQRDQPVTSVSRPGSQKIASDKLGPALASEPAPTLGGMMRELNATQKFSVMTMCWFSMVNFLVLGAWESNIPVFGHVRFGWSEYDAGNVIALGGLATLPLLFALVFVARYLQDRSILLAGLLLGLLGLSLHMGTLESPARSAVALLANTHASTSTSSASASASVSALATPTSKTNFGSFFTSWFLVALGYNMLTTITLSLLSKQIPAKFNGLTSTVIQLSNYTGRISGALWGSTLYQVGQFGIVTLELAVTLIGACLIGLMWRKIDVQKG